MQSGGGTRPTNLHPINLANTVWDVEIQGKRITVTTRLIEYKPQLVAKRGCISRFSEAARLRMLRWVASVNWRRMTRGHFFSFGYADDVAHNTKEQRKRHIYEFHRDMEIYLGREIPLSWRIEWEPRKSGRFVGEILPHWHMIVAGTSFLDYRKLRASWCRITRTKQVPNMRFDRLKNGDAVSMYIAKYAAKSEDALLLGNLSYGNITGKHYGYRRRNGFPMCKKTTFRDLTPDVVKRLRATAASCLPWYRADADGGFTLLGENAVKVQARLTQLCLDAGTLPEYDTPIKGKLA